MWTAHTLCCLSVCRNHWWTVNEINYIRVLSWNVYKLYWFHNNIETYILLYVVPCCGLERMLCFVEKSYIIITVHRGWLKWSLVWITAPMNAEQPYGMEHHAAYMAQGAYDPYGYSQKTNFMVHQGIKSKSKLLKHRNRTIYIQISWQSQPDIKKRVPSCADLVITLVIWSYESLLWVLMSTCFVD